MLDMDASLPSTPVTPSPATPSSRYKPKDYPRDSVWPNVSTPKSGGGQKFAAYVVSVGYKPGVYTSWCVSVLFDFFLPDTLL